MFNIMKIKIDHDEWGTLFDDPAMPFDEELVCRTNR
jgi:hypothetical protein